MKFKGGARIGKSYWKATNESFLFSSLKIQSDRLILSSFFHGQLCFERNDIESLTQRFYMTSVGLRLIHRKEGVPPYVVFWTLSPKLLQGELESHDWPVENQQPVLRDVLRKCRNYFVQE